MTGPVRRSAVKLEDLLLRHGAISQEQLEKAKDEQVKWGGDLGRIFVELGYISEELLMKAAAHQMGTQFCDPAKEQLDAEIVRAVGLQVAEQFGIIAVGGDLARKSLKIATSEPGNAAMLEQLQKLTGYKVEPCIATGASIGVAIRRYYYGEGGAVPKPAAAAEIEIEGLPHPRGAPRSSPTPPPKPPLVPPIAPVTMPPAGGGGLSLEAMSMRMSRIESHLASVRQDLSKEITSNPQIAGLAARLEALEQLSMNDVGSLRAVVEMLLERGVFKIEELAARVKSVRDKR